MKSSYSAGDYIKARTPVYNPPCPEALAWLQRHNYSVAEAWKECQRPDWMLWALRNVEHKPAPGSRVRETLCRITEAYFRYLEGVGEVIPDQYREAISRVRAWLAEASTDYSVLDVIADSVVETQSYDVLSHDMIEALCFHAGWCRGDNVIHSGSRAAATEFQYIIGEATDYETVPKTLLKQFCKIIRCEVPEFPE